MREVVRWPLLLACCCLAVAVRAEDADSSAWDLLMRLSQSHRTLNYEGILSFQRGDELLSLHLTHAVINDEEFERLEYLDGKQRKLIRRGHSIYCVHPGHQLRSLYGAQSISQQPLEAEKLKQYYSAKVVGSERIGNRETIKLNLVPLDTHRLAQHLAVDRETGLLVRSETVGEEKEVLERFQFVELSVGDKYSPDLFKLSGEDVELGHSVVPESAAEFSWRVDWLPGGFALAARDSKGDQGNREVVTYTDGLAAVSVFVEPLAAEDDGKGTAHRGATSAYSRAVAVDDTLYQVTVVGEIPMATAERMADSVSFSQPN